MKIKIRTSSPYNANLALYGDEVRILIFDDPAELEMGERPVMVRSGRGPFRPARARHARAMHEFFFENLQNPAPDRRAGAMHQFCSGQLNSSHQSEPRSACLCIRIWSFGAVWCPKLESPGTVLKFPGGFGFGQIPGPSSSLFWGAAAY